LQFKNRRSPGNAHLDIATRACSRIRL
jgi:hypothetical protein